MNFDPVALIPVLEAIAEVAGHVPVPWVTVAAAVMAGVALTLRKVYKKPAVAPITEASAPVAEIVQVPKNTAPVVPQAQEARVIELVNKTLKKD